MIHGKQPPSTSDKAEAGEAPVMELEKAPIKTAADGLVFPLEIRSEVRVRRRNKRPVLPGYDVNEERQKVGSAMAEGGATITGLSRDEEKRFLPMIINSSPSSGDWNKTVRAYYADISVEIPPDEKDHRAGGYKMEVGLRYETKEEYLADQSAPRDKNGAIRNPAGEPINIVDYIFWRYCLEYPEIANTEEQVNNSPRIRFFLYTKERETLLKKVALSKKREAQTIVNQNISDREWVEHMLRNFIAHDKDTKLLLKDLNSMNPDDKDILLDEYLEKDPDKFVALGKDKHLSMKSFIEQCIDRGLLVRIPNTNTILRNGESIANSLEDAVAYLLNSRNNDALTELKAQLRIAP